MAVVAFMPIVGIGLVLLPTALILYLKGYGWQALITMIFYVVLSFAALSFLGIGTETGYADWGQLLSFARNWISSLGTYWYIVVFPGITLVLYVMGWNLIGDAMRDVLDPRMRGKS